MTDPIGERNNIVAELNTVIVMLGQLPVRIDQLANVGVPITDCIQRIGRQVVAIKKLELAEPKKEDAEHEANHD